ncbi:MAG: inositol monophosphatase family protein [Myxococcota bacterium]
MAPLDLERAAAVAAHAADLARRETLPRFRDVAVETKRDGSPVTEADRAAERAIRAAIADAFPDHAILGEEYGGERDDARPTWVVDPIDGTIAYARGIPLFSTLVALVVDGEPLVGLIDLPALDERYVGWKGGGCRRNGAPVRVSQRSDLASAIVSHGDPFCFDAAGMRPAFERMAARLRMLRGYTDAFGHALVLGGGVDAMVDVDLNPWDVAATQVLVPEAGGVCHARTLPSGKLGLVLGSPALCDALLALVDGD